MTGESRFDPASQLERILLTYHVNDLSEAIRDAFIPGGVDALDDRLDELSANLLRVEEVVASLAAKVDEAARRSTRWTITIGRRTITISRGDDQAR